MISFEKIWMTHERSLRQALKAEFQATGSWSGRPFVLMRPAARAGRYRPSLRMNQDLNASIVTQGQRVHAGNHAKSETRTGVSL